MTDLPTAMTILGQLHDDVGVGQGVMFVPVEIVEAMLTAWFEKKTEYGVQLKNGGFTIRSEDVWVQRMLPLSKWIEDEQRHGGRVHKREIIIAQTWEMLKKGAQS